MELWTRTAILKNMCVYCPWYAVLRYLKQGLLGCAFGLGLGACLPTNASWDFGLSTQQITVVFPKQPTPSLANSNLVVVFQRSHTFIETSPHGRLVRKISARVLRPNDVGVAVVSLPVQVLEADFLFMTPNHLTDTLHWRRQLGVGSIRYHVSMPQDPAWPHHFYTFLLPQLNVLLTETRFNLNAAETLALAQWIQTQQKRLGEPIKTVPTQPFPFKNHSHRRP